MELLEVVERGTRGIEHVAATVEPPILLDAEAPARARDDLPQARSTTVRVREWIERALDDRQQRELGRHVALFERGHDVEQIQLAALEDAIEVVLIARVPRALALHGRSEE